MFLSEEERERERERERDREGERERKGGRERGRKDRVRMWLNHRFVERIKDFSFLRLFLR
jgi:hypothetical protein